MRTSLPAPDLPDGTGMPPVTPLTASVVALAIFRALPELLLINTELWAAVAALVWAVGGQLHAQGIFLALISAVIALPALWVTAQTLRLAVINRDAI